MRYEFKPSFDRSVKKLSPERRIKLKEAINALIDFFETGQKKKGLGLKQLRGHFWEIRVSIRDRVVFTFEEDTISFIITGNHDEIKRFLKNL